MRLKHGKTASKNAVRKHKKQPPEFRRLFYDLHQVCTIRLITYCVQMKYWCRRQDSNSRPPDYKSGALPTELHRLKEGRIMRIFPRRRKRFERKIRWRIFSFLFFLTKYLPQIIKPAAGCRVLPPTGAGGYALSAMFQAAAALWPRRSCAFRNVIPAFMLRRSTDGDGLCHGSDAVQTQSRTCVLRQIRDKTRLRRVAHKSCG